MSRRVPIEDQVPQISLLEAKPDSGWYHTVYMILKRRCSDCGEEIWYGDPEDTGTHNCPGPG